MEEEKKLYPFHLCPIRDEYSWGSEEFLLADLGYRDSPVKDSWLCANTLSEVMDTYIDRVVGERVFEYFGRQFPFTVKCIHCKGMSPLVVHPDDETAAQRYDFLGKRKTWFVMQAGDDARAHIGFNRDVTAAEVMEKCGDSSINGLLNCLPLEPGMVLDIAPGTVNCLSGESTVIEVSESSPMDFCLTSWGQPIGKEEFDEEFNLIEALDFIDFKANSTASREKPANNSYTANKINLKTPVKVTAGDNCSAYLCLSGEASLQMEVLGQKSITPVRPGEVLLVPAEVSRFSLAPIKENTVLLDIFCEPVEPKDKYIDQNADK